MAFVTGPSSGRPFAVIVALLSVTAVARPVHAQGFFPERPKSVTTSSMTGVLVGYGVRNGEASLTLRTEQGQDREFYFGGLKIDGRVYDCNSPPTDDSKPGPSECRNWPSNLRIGHDRVRIVYWHSAKPVTDSRTHKRVSTESVLATDELHILGPAAPKPLSTKANPSPPVTTSCVTRTEDPKAPTAVREGPALTAAIAGLLPNHTTIYPSSGHLGWVQITAPRRGWVATALTRFYCGTDPGALDRQLEQLGLWADFAKRGDKTAASSLARALTSRSLDGANAEAAEDSFYEVLKLHPNLVVSIIEEMSSGQATQFLQELMESEDIDLRALQRELADPRYAHSLAKRVFPAAQRNARVWKEKTARSDQRSSKS